MTAASGFFITHGVRGEPLYDSRYDPPVADAMTETYPHEQSEAGMVVHTE